MNSEELQNAKEQREFEERKLDKTLEFRKWLIDKLVTAGPGLVSAVLTAIITYYSVINNHEIAQTAKVATEARTEMSEKIDAGQAAAKKIAAEAKTAVEQAAAIASETKTAVEELKTKMPPAPDPE